jgi:5'/3'-nucleotidase SurE
MRRTVLLAALWLIAGAPASAQPLKVLVTNDDGVSAPGLDVLVRTLAENPHVALTVVAPADNSSGAGESRAGPVDVVAGATASGFPATVVDGFPGDAALFGVLQKMQADPPDLVVSGVNEGQNVSAEIIPVSGTVGAATWAARQGIPAFAVSAGLGAAPSYAQAATFAAELVEAFRVRKSFRRKMREDAPPFRGLVLNVNVPTCATGSVRGARVVPVGRVVVLTGYRLLADVGGVQSWQPTTASGGNFFTSDCTSTLEEVGNDLEAFSHGFATVTPLDPERSSTGRRLRDFRFVDKLF